MQDVQNIPAPAASPLDIEDNFDSHSDYPDIDSPRDNDNTDVESIPVPPDRQNQSIPIEEPPTSDDVEGIDDESGDPPKLM